MSLLVAIAVIAVVLVVLGVVVEGLLWLLFIGAVLIAIAFLVGVVRRRGTGTRAR